MPDEKRLRDLYNYLKKSGSDAIGEANENEFVSELKDSNRVKDLYGYLKKSGSDAIGEASERDFLDELGYGSNQAPPQQTQNPQPQPQPNVAAQTPTPAPQPNLQKVGDKTFDSNSAQKLFTDIEGNDVLQVVTNDGVEHGIVRKSDGSYDWYRGDIEGDILATRLKTTATNSDKGYEGIRRTWTATERGIDVSKESEIASKEEDDIQSTQIKKAAYAITNKDKPIDQQKWDNLTAEEKYKMGLTSVEEEDLRESTLKNQKSRGEQEIPFGTYNEFTFRNNALKEQSDAIRYTTESLVNGLQGKYGKRFEDYLNFAETGTQQYLDAMDKARKAKDVNSFNALLQEYNAQKEGFQDIESDPDFAILGDFNKKLNENKYRTSQLLNQDYFKVARDLTDMYWAEQATRDAKAGIQKKAENKDWNEGGILGKAKTIASQTGTAVKATPEIVATSISKIPTGLITAVKIGTDMLGQNDTGKIDIVSALNSQANNFLDKVDLNSDLSTDFKNTNTYAIMQGLSDLIPQVALAEITGGIGGAIGRGVGFEAGAASATTKAGLEMARQGISSVGFMANDMYEQNMAILDDVEGLTPEEKQKAASRLAFMQSAAVGVGGSLVGGALGSALGKAGLLDDQIGRILNMDGISQSEIRAVFQKSANLLKDGALKEYADATSKGISDLLAKKWGNNAADVLKGLAKSSTGSAAKSGVEETLEEFAFEPLTQYVAEQSYKAFGGDVDIDKLYEKQKREEEESRKQSGRTEIDDYLSVFAVGAIAKGFGNARQNLFDKNGKQNEMVNQAMLVAMKDMPEFQRQMAKYKKSQLANLDPKSPEYQRKSEALDKIEQDATERIELIRNGGSTNKSGVSTFDAYSKITKGQVDGELVNLLGQKADLELEYQALSPSKGESDAIKRDNQNTEQSGSKNTFTKAQDKKLTEIKAVQSEIDNLVTANSKTLSSRYQGLKDWITKKKDRTPDEQISEKQQVIEEKAKAQEVSTDDLVGIDTYDDLPPEEKNAIQAEIDNNPENQVEIVKPFIERLESKKIDNQREVANQQSLTNEDLKYNTDLRTPDGKKDKKDDTNNIAFKKDRQYAYATEEQVNALNETKGKGLKFNKGVTKGAKADYVVERTKDENGNLRTRVYERTDNGFEVIQDQIGDKALLNNADRKNIENTRYKNASVKAENKREEIIGRVANGNRNYLPNEVEAELSKDKEYQSLVKEAQDLAPKSSFWGDVANTVQTIKQSFLPDTTKIDKAIKDKIKDLKKKKEIEEVDCIAIAENGIHTDFKGGGIWKIVKKIEGATHEKGGVDIKL